MAHQQLVDILLWIAAEQRRWAESIAVQQGKLSDLYNDIQVWYPKIDEETLERLIKPKEADLKEQVEFSDRNGFLHLWPITKRGYFLPVMTAKYDFTGSNEEARFRVAIFHLNPKNPKGVGACGYRFETPEANKDHNYFHVQQIVSLTGGKLLPCDELLPEEQPAFCLDADDPVSLLISLLLSLYGFERVTSLLKKGFGRNLNPKIQKLWWCKRNSDVFKK